MRRLDEVLADLPFFAGLDPERLEFVAGCASNVHFAAGDILFREGDAADTFYVVRHGPRAGRRVMRNSRRCRHTRVTSS